MTKFGTKLTAEHRQKLRISHLGKKIPTEQKLKMRIAHLAEKNHEWKGNNVGYRGIHRWIQENFGKADKCSFDPSHESPRFHWANISGSYLRDINDWAPLCAKCHKNYDMLRSGRGIYL